jgi:hypothetical protein
MRNILALVSATILVGSLSAWAAEPAAKDATATHSAASMMSGHHMMPGNKQDQMSNKAGMSGLNPKCSDAALAKMPADHRAACHKSD